MASSEAPYGGSEGDKFRIRIIVDVVSQEINNNRSRLRVRGQMRRVIAGSRVWNLDPSPWSVGASGSGGWSGHLTYDTTGTTTIQYLDTQYWRNHNADGTQSVSWSGNNDAQNSPFLTTAVTSGSTGLPTIPRFANITSFTRDQITDTSFRTNVSVSPTCNALQYSLNGGGWQTAHNGNFTSRSFTLSGLLSDTHYTIRVRVRRADSGQWTASGTAGVDTLPQNKFFGRRV